MENLLHLKIYGFKEENISKRYVCLDNCFMYISPGEHNKLAYPTSIPVGTILECQCNYDYFTYTSYNGVNGWIIDINIITTANTIMYSKPLEEKVYETSLTIPQNTVLHVPYTYEYGNISYEGFFMITYNNQTGWIKAGKCAVEVDEKDTFNKTIEFSEDIMVDGNVVIKKGETINLTSKYIYLNYAYSENNYYFNYNNYGLWSSDLGIYYPEETYIILFKNYKDLPINKKLKVKYYTSLFKGENLISAYYIEYNNQIYDLRKNLTYLVVDETKYNICKVEKSFNLIKTPYDNNIVASLNSGDIICEYTANLYEEYERKYFYYFMTQDGIAGYSNDMWDKFTTIAYGVSKEELPKYFTIKEKNEIIFLNNNSSGKYVELLKYDLSGDYITQNDITMYTNFFDENDKEEILVPVNSQISMLGTAAIIEFEENKGPYYYISYEDKNGYAIIESGDIEKKIEEPSGDITNSGDENLNIYEIQSQKKEASATTICILCVCGAIILTITAIVTIKLINKSSKKNNDSDNKND